MQSAIREILKAKFQVLHSIKHDRSVLEAASIMTDLDIGVLVVLHGDRPTGLLTLRHIIHRILVPGIDASTTWLSELEPLPIIPILSTATVEEALSTMAHHHSRYLAVCAEDGRLVGIVSRGDLLHWLSRDRDFQISDLINYIRSS